MFLINDIVLTKDEQKKVYKIFDDNKDCKILNIGKIVNYEFRICVLSSAMENIY